MRNVEPDATELLIKALDLAVGASALSRYASQHTSDARLRRLFRQFANTSSHQERALRRQLARTAGPPGAAPGRRQVAGLAALGLAVVAALGLGIAVFARRWGGGGNGPGGTGARGPAGTQSGGRDGAFGAARGVSSLR
jgi:ferric-dicitrate binding protein FerR (iron transport regulator)